MGSTRKRNKPEDEPKCIERIKSNIIDTLEDKKQKRESKQAQALETDIKNNGKNKAIMEIYDDNMSNSNNNDNEEGPTKKTSRSKEHQLITSIKELGRKFQNANTSGTNDSSSNPISLNQILEIIIDFLHRKDLHELFVESVNPNVVEEYYEIVKQIMDFDTVKTKVNEGMYTNLEQFKHDVFMICSNAMNVNSENLKYHQVAANISWYIKRIFEALSIDSEHFELEFALEKGCTSRKLVNEKWKTLLRASFNPNEKRDMCWSPSHPLVSEVLYANNPDIQLNENSIKHKESQLQFVEDLTLSTQIDAHKQIQEYLRDLELIRNATAQENKIFNTINVGDVNIRDDPYQRNKTYTNGRWNASFLRNFFNNEKSGNSSGIESSNAREAGNYLDPSKKKMVSPFKNVSSFLAPIHEHALQLESRVNNSVRPWNTLDGVSNIFSIESSNNVFARVFPTPLISEPQPQPLNFKLSENGNLSGLSQSRPETCMSFMLNNSLTESLVHQPQQESSILSSLVADFCNELDTSADFKDNTYLMQISQELVHQQAATYIPQVTEGFPNVQIQERKD